MAQDTSRKTGVKGGADATNRERWSDDKASKAKGAGLSPARDALAWAARKDRNASERRRERIADDELERASD